MLEIVYEDEAWRKFALQKLQRKLFSLYKIFFLHVTKIFASQVNMTK